ncbi:hypothetical protein Ppa06_61960 [Planomonospora parontospora subsp. parontospora]|uniref:HEAT repeat domain-containing protein n=2 Tax=Planomonospora parontospora TaxID=58119 RepID=A0AA37F7K3_9ACTN|nr:HEAT repeat domain-containing protein [Planomonospora parontospora]GGK93774.1 hypothetical protein GCM10010126_61430 [Planomonospora parontospora]GII12398.1 hypothetical protein Ppa06_61960 [Planomonospora parontospora subsp. parontospora]
MVLTFDEAIERLTDRAAPRRLSGARRLRRLADPAAGPVLLDALRREVDGPRTWETLYNLVMALGSCDHRATVPYLYELARHPFTATAVHTAVGDALVRLDREHHDDPGPIHRCLDTGNESLLDGAFRAMAMLRMVPDDAAIGRILDFLAPRPSEDGLRFWPAVAAAGWQGEAVRAFLTGCAAGPREDVVEAAAYSLTGRYKTYRHL